MKKTVMFLILTVGLLTAACQKEAPLSSDSGVGFSLGRNIVEVPAEGGTASVYWVVEKPIEGETLRIFKEVEWIHNIDTSVEGELRFEVEPTDLEVDSREAVVTVSYGEETGEFTVIQAGMEPAISFSVVMSTPTSIVVCVEPEDESMNYFANVVEKEIWETYKSDGMYLRRTLISSRILRKCRECRWQNGCHSSLTTPGHCLRIFSFIMSIMGKMDIGN